MIEILATPPLNSVQDAGTAEARIYGFGPGGAMDLLAYHALNALLGNTSEAACLEIQMYPVRFRFTCDTRFAITGSAKVKLDGQTLPSWWVARAKAGQSIELERGDGYGARAYLGVDGGIDIPEILGSRGTRPKGFGGYKGRAVKKGDLLPIATAADTPGSSDRASDFGVLPPHEILTHAIPQSDGCLAVRMLRAGEYEQLTDDSKQQLWDSPFSVSEKSNRQGCRLDGHRLFRSTDVEMRSQPLVPGVMQLTPQGTLIVLMSDTNAAGGYPRVGTVIEADLWKLAQARPLQPIRFLDCSYEEAVAATRELRSYLDKVRTAAELWSRS